ncbi:RhuM family protein [Microbacterium sp. BH-3-3-3]|uniref:RhuM family protein n=1 Tax=Microbacterium sp. BH-3-3-3 TaxID=1906742 RepID=UPI0011A4DE6A|nr:RhuM family protein [Microbacterium sp. BH-3-3-3]
MSEPDANGEIVLYTTDDGLANVKLRAIDGTAWLTQAQIAELFQTSKQNVSLHVTNILEEGEVEDARTVKEFLTVRFEGTRRVERSLTHYNLDMILAIGYRVRSPRGTQFRRWATTVLAEYLVKGFAMDDAKLKDAPQWDYFDEWLERIRDIRASEKRFYQKVTDLYATAVDYDATSDAAKTFFAKVQNKMLFAVTGKTAAEIIAARSDAGSPNMGLTSWNSGRVRKADVSVGKNYLSQDELSELNRIVTMYLDFAEDQARRRQTVTMDEWAEKLDAFLQFNGRDLLANAGSVQAAVAKRLAEGRYDEFDAHRRRAEAADADAADFAAIEKLGRDAE